MRTRFGAVAIVVAFLSGLLGTTQQASGAITAFPAGTLVIPMDTTRQDTGMLKAFGLVYRLLSNGIPVHQAIAAGKVQGGTDFVASGTDVQTSTSITNHNYRGGPFIIDAAHRTAALDVIADWHLLNVTTVHSMQAFSADVARTLLAVPKIAVYASGNELIVFNNLNAAGIPDSTGQSWPAAADATRVYAGYPDVLNLAEIRGVNVGSGDGALLTPNGSPAYCHLTSASPTISPDDEAVFEVRTWLASSPRTHAFLQNLAVTTFENSAGGRFLTTNGVVNDGATPNPTANRIPTDPLAQYDGPFTVDFGSVDSIGLASMSAFRAGARTLINLNSANLLSRIAFMSGVLDGDATKGTVTFLGGHDYSTTLPISTNPQTNGVKLYLNSLLQPTTCLTTETLTVTNDGSGTGTVTSDVAGIDCGSDCSQDYLESTVVTLTADADAGSRFAGWTGAGCSGTGPCVVTMDQAQSVTATFTKLWTLTVTRKGKGTVTSTPVGILCGADCSQTYVEGTVVTLKVKAKRGWRFKGWSGGACAGKSKSCAVTMDAAKAATARFKKR